MATPATRYDPARARTALFRRKFAFHNQIAIGDRALRPTSQLGNPIRHLQNPEKVSEL
jgi:hypothetical protein